MQCPSVGPGHNALNGRHIAVRINDGASSAKKVKNLLHQVLLLLQLPPHSLVSLYAASAAQTPSVRDAHTRLLATLIILSTLRQSQMTV